MNKLLSIIFVLTLFHFGRSQDSIAHTWNKVQDYKLSKDEVWSVDVLENFYSSNKGIINKYNPEGELLFSQSIKSLGKMSKLVPLSTMKLIHFSEEQQTICYFDNTLSSLDDCIDLSEEGISNAVLICSSSQPSKLWVLDNIDSRLVLLSLDGLNQRQELKNLRGILKIEQVSQIIERGNRLFLLDKTKGVYIFDLYGSLIEFIPQESIQQLDAYENTLFTLEENTLHLRSLKNGLTMDLTLPIDGVYEFAYRSQHFYFRNNKGVHKYELQFSE